jgi:hypothetical protein
MAHLIRASVLIAALWPPVLVGGEPATASDATTTRAQQAKTMKIRMDVNGTGVTATLDDNETSREFVSLLPLTLTLEDYNSTEKISNLAKKLSTKGAPAGIDPPPEISPITHRGATWRSSTRTSGIRAAS